MDENTAVQELKTPTGKQPDEPKIAQALIDENDLHTCNGKTYNLDGEVSDLELERAVADALVRMGFTTRVAARAKAIVALSKMLSTEESIPLNRQAIPVQNGTVIIEKDGSATFSPERRLAPYRLNCSYNPSAKDLAHFLKWLSDLLTPKDQVTFQEIMGYLLLPSTQGQMAFFLLGTGGEGKSIWGTILYALFGNAFVPTKVYELEENRFTIATIENRLIAYDDDMDHSKLKKTDNFKTIVTAKTPIMGERKGADKFMFLPYARICACGNFALSSLHDTSDGFFRRLLPIRVKNRPEGRRNISDLEQYILPELDAIFMWSLEGLKRLIENDYKFSISEKSKELLADLVEESNSMATFLSKEVIFEEGAKVTTKALESAYKYYCSRTGDVFRGGPHGLVGYLKAREETFHIKYSKRVSGDNRGFVGVKLKNCGIDLDSILGKGGDKK